MGAETKGSIGRSGRRQGVALALGLLAPLSAWATSDLAAGRAATCAVGDDHHVVCWGAGPVIDIGAPLRERRHKSEEEETSTQERIDGEVRQIPSLRAVDVDLAGRYACAVDGTGAVWCWGEGVPGRAATDTALARVPGIERAREVATGGDHACALLTDGSAACWGRRDLGQLGDGTLDATVPPATTPIPVKGLAGLIALDAGQEHTCALDAEGTVWCWGVSFSGQCGTSTPDSSVPQRVAEIGRSVDLATGARHTCTVSDAGEVYCWGADDAGQLGRATRSPGRHPDAERVEGLDGVAVSLTAGDAHTCARLTGGRLSCWGDVDGSGGAAPYTRPTLLDALSPARAIASGERHACAVRESGAVWCWGLWGPLNARELTQVAPLSL